MDESAGGRVILLSIYLATRALKSDFISSFALP